MSDPVFIDTAGAARRICIASSTLEKMRVNGNGPPFIQVTRRRIIYDVSELDAWARARQVRSTSEYQDHAGGDRAPADAGRQAKGVQRIQY